MASSYNLQGAKGKEPARPDEASPGRQGETSPDSGQGNLEDTVNRLVVDVATYEKALSFAAETFEGFKEEMKLMREQMAESVAVNRSLSDLVKTLQDEVAELRASNQRLLRTSSSSSSHERTSRVDVQRPAKYSGSRDARVIDNCLFQVDYYLDLQNVVEEDLRIKTTTMLLEGDVVAWWRRKMFDVENGDCMIATFDDFRKQLKGYFMPVDAERQTYRMGVNLRQTGSLREYVRAYQELMLDVPKMPKKDKLNWFITGLQSWAQADVERSDPKTLEQAYVAVERLADTQRKSYTETFKSTRKSDHNGKEERRDRSGSSFQRQNGGRQFFRRDYSGPPKEVICWVCGERHEARVCPKRIRPTGQANAARATEAGTSRSSANALQSGDVEESRIGALQLLHALTKEEEAKVTTTPSTELMCIEILVNGRPTIAMVDTGATHNFISEEEVGRLGLTRGKGESRVKAVNSEARPIYFIVRDAVVKIEGWSGRANFSVVQTDDFQMILGMEFLCASKMVPMPHLRSVSIMDERHPCMVPVVPTRKDKGKAVSEDSNKSLPERDLTVQRVPPTKQAIDRRVEKILRQKANPQGEPKKYQVKWIVPERFAPAWTGEGLRPTGESLAAPHGLKESACDTCYGFSRMKHNRVITETDDRGSRGLVVHHSGLEQQRGEWQRWSSLASPLHTYLVKEEATKDEEIGLHLDGGIELQKTWEDNASKISLHALSRDEASQLMHVEGRLHGRPINVLVDIGSTHNFISEKMLLGGGLASF
ncbi:hypothetical protein EJ110_NYTH34457 [Nymphaea thermarum]|nr:hypothetical protein EJ110_NYTH34457 [Nymphaea thermarum]